jgi:hypothetical protein
MDWIDCRDGFFEADIIRFREGVFERKGPRAKQKAYKIGDREIVAEVVKEYEDEDGFWVVLLVRSSRVLSDDTFGRKVHALKDGEEIRKARDSIVKWGSPERMPWSDESARERVAADRKPSPRRKRRPSK